MATRHRPPNILILVTDQHNPHVAGFAGDRTAHTENLDRLAANSFQFDAAYCQDPLCTPSRISMWTGRLIHRCGAWRNNLPIPEGLITIPEHFGRHGYATCGVGKMHVGGERPMNGFQLRPYGDLVPNACATHQPDPRRTIVNHAWTSHQVGRFPFAGESEIPESLTQDRVVTRRHWLTSSTMRTGARNSPGSSAGHTNVRTTRSPPRYGTFDGTGRRDRTSTPGPRAIRTVFTPMTGFWWRISGWRNSAGTSSGAASPPTMPASISWMTVWGNW